MRTISKDFFIDFTIENHFHQEGKSVLYIEDSFDANDPSNWVTFTIENKGRHVAKLPSISVVLPSAFHFAISFRPGTLYDKKAQEITDAFRNGLNQDEEHLWLVYYQHRNDADDSQTIYIACEPGLKLQASHNFSFTVKGLSAWPGSEGSRTSHVQLMTQLYYPFYGRWKPVTSYRNKRLDIVNHEGKANMPLEVILLGDRQLQCGKANNSLRMQFFEELGRAINTSEETKIHAYFPYYIGKKYDPGIHPAWVLGNLESIQNVTLNSAVGDGASFHHDTDTNSTITYKNWGYQLIELNCITPKSQASFDTLILEFDNIPALVSAGETEIKIKIENIPGYWDIDLKLSVAKVQVAPVTVNGELHVTGDIVADHEVHSKNKVFIGNESGLDAVRSSWEKEGPDHADDAGLIFLPESAGESDHAWLRMHSRSGKAHNFEIIVGDNSGDHMVIDSIAGKVGIGDKNLKLSDNKEKIQLGDAVAFSKYANFLGKLKINGAAFSKAGFAKHGDSIAPPSGNISDWNIMVSIRTTTFSEQGSEQDNALLALSCFAKDDPTNNSWIITAIEHYRYGNSNDKILDANCLVNYLIVPA